MAGQAAPAASSCPPRATAAASPGSSSNRRIAVGDRLRRRAGPPTSRTVTPVDQRRVALVRDGGQDRAAVLERGEQRTALRRHPGGEGQHDGVGRRQQLRHLRPVDPARERAPGRRRPRSAIRRSTSARNDRASSPGSASEANPPATTTWTSTPASRSRAVASISSRTPLTGCTKPKNTSSGTPSGSAEPGPDARPGARGVRTRARDVRPDRDQGRFAVQPARARRAAWPSLVTTSARLRGPSSPLSRS